MKKPKIKSRLVWAIVCDGTLCFSPTGQAEIFGTKQEAVGALGGDHSANVQRVLVTAPRRKK